MTARGIRLNNPLNIRRGPVMWVGRAPVQLDPAFVTFSSVEYGFRAAVKIWLQYRARGIDTLREIVTTWAPPSENDTAAYLADVAHRTGFHPDAPLDVRDPDTLTALLYAFTWHECGSWPYEPSQVRAGISLAIGGGGLAKTTGAAAGAVPPHPAA